MIKLLAVAGMTLVFATSAEALPRLPLHQPDGLITQVREGCGVGRYRVNGVCVTRRGYYGYGYRRYGYYGPRTYGYYGYRPYRSYGYYGVRRPYWRGRAYRSWWW
jgi:hypothetical protein